MHSGRHVRGDGDVPEQVGLPVSSYTGGAPDKSINEYKANRRKGIYKNTK